MFFCFKGILCLWVASVFITGATHADEWQDWEKSEQSQFDLQESQGLADWSSYENKIL